MVYRSVIKDLEVVKMSRFGVTCHLKKPTTRWSDVGRCGI